MPRFGGHGNILKSDTLSHRGRKQPPREKPREQQANSREQTWHRKDICHPVAGAVVVVVAGAVAVVVAGAVAVVVAISTVTGMAVRGGMADLPAMLCSTG